MSGGRPERTPRRGMCAAVLSFEAVTVALSTPVMVAISDVSLAPALVAGLGVAVLCLLVAGMLRSDAGYVAGWVVQGAAIALGLLVPLMFFLGGLFGVLWATADLLGRRIEAERGAAYAAFEAERAAGHDAEADAGLDVAPDGGDGADGPPR